MVPFVTGREFNPHSGNYYFRYRTYNPSIGAFTSRDPLGYVDGMSQYNGYFAAVLMVDPMGMLTIVRKKYHRVFEAPKDKTAAATAGPEILDVVFEIYKDSAKSIMCWCLKVVKVTWRSVITMPEETWFRRHHKFNLDIFLERRRKIHKGELSIKEFYEAGINLNYGATLAHELKHVEQHKETVPLAIKKVAEEMNMCYYTKDLANKEIEIIKRKTKNRNLPGFGVAYKTILKNFKTSKTGFIWNEEEATMAYIKHLEKQYKLTPPRGRGW